MAKADRTPAGTAKRAGPRRRATGTPAGPADEAHGVVRAGPAGPGEPAEHRARAATATIDGGPGEGDQPPTEAGGGTGRPETAPAPRAEEDAPAEEPPRPAEAQAPGEAQVPDDGPAAAAVVSAEPGRSARPAALEAGWSAWRWSWRVQRAVLDLPAKQTADALRTGQAIATCGSLPAALRLQQQLAARMVEDGAAHWQALLAEMSGPR